MSTQAITKIIIKGLFKVLLTPIMIVITIILLAAYSIYGLVSVPIQSIRYLGLTVIAGVRSAFYNRDFTNIFLDALYHYLSKYFSFFHQIFKIPLALWINPEENPSTLLSILKYEREIISKNWVSSILIYISLIFSIGWTFSYLTFTAKNSYEYYAWQEEKKSILKLQQDLNVEKQEQDLRNRIIREYEEFTDEVETRARQFIYDSLKIDYTNVKYDQSTDSVEFFNTNQFYIKGSLVYKSAEGNDYKVIYDSQMKFLGGAKMVADNWTMEWFKIFAIKKIE